MKQKILLSLLLAIMLVGCEGTDGGEENDDESYSSELNYDSDDNKDVDYSANISYHNQGSSCLTCHGTSVSRDNDDDDENGDNEKNFYSGGTVYTTLDGTSSNQYAGGYMIRLLLDNGQSVSYRYNSEGGTANSYTEDSRVLSYPFTAQVVNASGSVVNASATNSHNSSRVDCNSCHTSTGNSGAAGRITSSSQSVATPVEPVVPSTLTFTNDVYPILNASCSTVGCHGDNTTNFVITTEAETYSNIGSYITPNGIESLLLTKASSSVSHGGGTILAASGSEYGTIRDWIDSGAVYGTTTTTVPVVVAPTVLSFANDVLPALESSCKSCHGSSGNFTITTASATYANISNFNGINVGVPENSRLLTKSIGVSHGGGAVWSTSTSGYVTVKDWISQGALNN